jgi:hypothetical protein
MRTAIKAINKHTRREKVEIEKSLQKIQAGAPNLDICRLTAAAAWKTFGHPSMRWPIERKPAPSVAERAGSSILT